MQLRARAPRGTAVAGAVVLALGLVALVSGALAQRAHDRLVRDGVLADATVVRTVPCRAACLLRPDRLEVGVMVDRGTARALVPTDTPYAAGDVVRVRVASGDGDALVAQLAVNPPAPWRRQYGLGVTALVVAALLVGLAAASTRGTRRGVAAD